MRKIMNLSVVVVLTLLMCLAAGCGDSGEKQTVSETKMITITDSSERSVEVPCPPKRIVVCNSDVAEMICALGSAESIVGASDATITDPIMKPKLEGAEDVGKSFTPSVEKIVSLKPDLVFGYASFLKQDSVDQLEQMGTPIVLLDCYKPETMTKDIETLGKILGKEKQAKEYIAVYDKYQKLITERTKTLSSEEKPLVYLEGYTDYTVASGNSGGAQVLAAAGGKNIASDISDSSAKVSEEWVLSRNPQVIIKAASSSIPSGYGKSEDAMKEKRKEIMSRPSWGKIDAVKSDKVYLLSSDIYVGPRMVVGMAYFAKWLHPELFKDVDPEAIHKEFLQKFHNMEPKGVWTYP
ncbi:MAG: ABC transporter substrate-binding protein [Syntrophaceticus schinkii]|jgi:iron complex transport system substrate-binding protein|nr:ABC transporter substrate-binding protein [Syntrophaceticus schinkii]